MEASEEERKKEPTTVRQNSQIKRSREKAINAMVQWPDDVSFRTLLVSVLTVGLSYGARDIYNHTLKTYDAKCHIAFRFQRHPIKTAT